MVGQSGRKVHRARRRELPVVSYANPEDPFLRRAAIGLVEAFSGKRRIKKLYHDYHLNGDKTRKLEYALAQALDMTQASLTGSA